MKEAFSHMADQMAIVRARHTVQPLLLLLGPAFGHGALQAAGPGHGKAVALSYMLTRRRKALDAVFFGNTVALFHGLSGIAFVLVVKLVLQKSVNATLAEMAHIAQVVSFSLIMGLGGSFDPGHGWLDQTRATCVRGPSSLFQLEI
jgi:ABC-type nickel/cobalt efflux system permease component RcnA